MVVNEFFPKGSIKPFHTGVHFAYDPGSTHTMASVSGWTVCHSWLAAVTALMAFMRKDLHHTPES